MPSLVAYNTRALWPKSYEEAHEAIRSLGTTPNDEECIKASGFPEHVSLTFTSFRTTAVMFKGGGDSEWIDPDMSLLHPDSVKRRVATILMIAFVVPGFYLLSYGPYCYLMMKRGGIHAPISPAFYEPARWVCFYDERYEDYLMWFKSKALNG